MALYAIIFIAVALGTSSVAHGSDPALATQPSIKVLSHRLVAEAAAEDVSTRAEGEGKWCEDQMSIELNGRGAFTVPATQIQTALGEPFSISVWVRPSSAGGQRMFLYSDWSFPWSFLIALQKYPASSKHFPNYSGFVSLRRHAQSSSGLAGLRGGVVPVDAWTHLTVTWADGVLVLYTNASKAAQAHRIETAGSETRITSNSHATHDVGMKRDTNSDFFVGKMRHLIVARGAVSAQSGEVRRRDFRVLMYHTHFTSEPSIAILSRHLISKTYDDPRGTVLMPSTRWVEGNQVVQFGGTANDGVKIPGVYFGDTDYSISVWVRPSSPTRSMPIFRDWRGISGSPGDAFAINLLRSEESPNFFSVFVRIARDRIEGNSNALTDDLVRFTGGRIFPNRWSHLVLTWNGDAGLLSVYINGLEVGVAQRFVHAGGERNFKRTNHSEHWVGFQVLANVTTAFQGQMRHLSIARGAVQKASKTGTADLGLLSSTSGLIVSKLFLLVQSEGSGALSSAQYEVTGNFTTWQEARTALNKFSASSTVPSRAVIEIINGVAQPDPHSIDGQNQGGGSAAGWNKFWWNRFDIERLVAAAQHWIVTSLIA